MGYHIDVHHMKRGIGRPFHALITSGMSKRPMGTDARMDALDAAGVDDVARQARPRAGSQNKFLGSF